MDKMIAYCGLACTECGAFIATQNDDDVKRKEIAALWTKEYKHDFKPEDINCLGCMSDSQIVFVHCHHCDVRKCGQEKGVENCAYCNDYACDKLVKFFQRLGDREGRLFPMAPMFQTTLEEVRKGLGK